MPPSQFVPFLPRVAADPRLAHEGRITRMAVTMFADIAGFTSLSERLGRRGTAGTEQLGAIIRRALGGAIDAVDAADGDTLAFGGDAITIAFARGDGDAWTRARRTGLRIIDIVDRLNGQETIIGSLELSVKVGVAAGRVTTMLSSRADRDIVVHLGPGLDRAVAAEQEATPGSLVMHRSDVDLDGLVTGRRDPALARRTLHPLLANRLDEQLVLRDEHRRVSVVFVSLPPVDDRSPAALQHLEQVLGTAGNLFDALGGQLVQCTGGDKGLVIFGAFGAPLAHADDAARAVHVAERLRELTGVPTRAGISTGLTFVSIVAGKRRSFAQLIGDTVNQAARLMHVAPAGATLIEGHTRRAAGDAVVATDGELLSVKGKSTPLSVHRVTSLTGWIGSFAVGETPLVGRDADVELVVQAAQACRDAAGGLVHVEGAAGSGKTRVVDEVAGRLELLGVAVERERFEGYGLGASYGPFRGLLARRLELQPGAGPAEVEVALSRTMPGHERALPLIAGILGVNVHDNVFTGRMPDDERAELTRRTVVSLLSMVDEPTVLVIEDVHWADEASAAALASLAEASGKSRLSVVTTRRPAERGHPRIPGPVVELSDLSPDDLSTIVRDTWSALGGAQLDDEQVGQIVDRSSGSPLYAAVVCELVRSTWSPGRPLPDVPLHEELLGFLSEQLDSLPGDLGELALRCAIVGRAVTSADLSTMFHLEKRALDADLGRLSEAGVLRLGAHGYELRHATLGDALRERVSHADRAPLHRAVAQWLMARGEAPREIAGHLERSGGARDAIGWFRAARDEAYRMWSVREAHRWAALTVATKDHQSTDALAIVEIELVLGDYAAAENRLTSLDSDDLDDDARADRSRMLGKLCLETGRLAEGVAHLHDAERWGSTGPELAWPMTMALCDLGRFDDAEQRARHRLESGDAHTRLDALANLGVVLARRGEFVDAAAALEQASAAAEELGDLMRLIHATGDLAGVRFETGALRESVTLLERASALAQRLGAHRALTMALGNQAQVRLAVGDMGGAERAAAAASIAALQLPDAGLALLFAETPIVVAEAAGDIYRARDWWSRHAQLELALGRPHDAAISLLRHAALLGHIGQKREAADCIIDAERLLAGTDTTEDVSLHLERAMRASVGHLEPPPEVLDIVETQVHLPPLDTSVAAVTPEIIDELLDRIEHLVRAAAPERDVGDLDLTRAAASSAT
ncbi:MAG: AAA family ATPase [Actinomycetota bacterium]|nr:AAA family ATPase [Actinomycetota bacterium]